MCGKAVIRLAAVLALLSGSAAAQEVVAAGGDTIEIRASETNFAEVLYANSISENSTEGKYVLEFQGVEVVVFLDVTPGTAEHIQVTPQDRSYTADPAEVLVEDGETVTIQIIQPMF